MAKPTEQDRIAALKAAQADQQREIAELSLPRLQRLRELIAARRENTAELEALAKEVPHPKADEWLKLLIGGALSASEAQLLPLLNNAVTVMSSDCDAALAAPTEG